MVLTNDVLAIQHFSAEGTERIQFPSTIVELYDENVGIRRFHCFLP